MACLFLILGPGTSRFFCGVKASTEGNFDAGKRTAESLKTNVDGEIKSGKNKSNVPQFKDGFTISETETATTRDHVNKNEAAKAVFEMGQNRKKFTFAEKDPMIERGEEIQKNPEKVLDEIEAVEVDGAANYTIEYCEECSEEEYFVKARRTKKRYVYLDKPPYITASNYCENHKTLTIRVEIPAEPEGIFREDGQFEKIEFLGKQEGGAIIDERYRVNGHELILRKTIMQDGRPWIHPECWMVPHLQNQVLGADYLIRELLGGAENKDLDWGKLGKARLHHRVVNDTGEHYWIEDDQCQECEKLGPFT
jgi:hypothetical protein